MIRVPRLIAVLAASLIGATIAMTQTAAAGPDAASDSQIDRRVRTCRADPDKDQVPGPVVPLDDLVRDPGDRAAKPLTVDDLRLLADVFH